MSTLHLVLTHHWFDETEAERKQVEYRKLTPRWRKLIYDRRDTLTHVRFQRAYSKSPPTLTRSITQIDIGKCPIEGFDDGDVIRIHSAPIAQIETNPTHHSQTQFGRVIDQINRELIWPITNPRQRTAARIQRQRTITLIMKANLIR